MEISSANSSPAPASKPASGTARSRETVPSRGGGASTPAASLSLRAYEPIQQAMNNCPDSRAEVIARGKALAADPNYPNTEVVTSLARLFVADAQSALAKD